MKKILILTDGKAGHENQSKAFARALGFDFDLKPIKFKSPFSKALSYLFDRIGLHSLSVFEPGSVEGDYAAVIGTGSGTFYAAKTLARRLGVKCGVVLYPRGYRLGGFDCVMAPSFDRPRRAKNVIEIPANLVANDPEFYEKGVKAFYEHGGEVAQGAEAIAVIIGGPNKCSTLTPAWLKSQLDPIFAESKNRKILFWVTTSRRTPPEVEALVDTYPWDYRLLYSRDHFNPIPAFVKLAKKLYVTAESTGMLSEACTCGEAEVHALDNLKTGPHKFRRFVEGLAAGGYLGGNRKIDLSAQIAAASKLLALS